jgi:hypothetical protein
MGPCLENDWSEARVLSNTPSILEIRIDIQTVWLLEELRANLEGEDGVVSGRTPLSAGRIQKCRRTWGPAFITKRIPPVNTSVDSESG